MKIYFIYGTPPAISQLFAPKPSRPIAGYLVLVAIFHPLVVENIQ